MVNLCEAASGRTYRNCPQRSKGLRAPASSEFGLALGHGPSEACGFQTLEEIAIRSALVTNHAGPLAALLKV